MMGSPRGCSLTRSNDARWGPGTVKDGRVTEFFAEVDEAGNLKLPTELAAALGLRPGSRVKARRCGERLLLARSVSQLARIYVEPTTACNLHCLTCIRNVWDEPIGHMTAETFATVLEGIQALPERPTVVLGGLGEPLVHPGILDMLGDLKRTEAQVELITNGILLDEPRTKALIDIGLDGLWVSLDGASPECYAGVRVDGDLPTIMAHLERLRDLKIMARVQHPRLGVAFVAMKRNLAELPEVLKLEYRIGAREFLITHVYPHTEELLKEALYVRAIGDSLRSRSRIRLARPDFTPETAWILDAMIKGRYGARIEGLDALWPVDMCPFVLRGSTCVRWDGQVSPCLPLLHRHTSYLGRRLRTSEAYTVGSLCDRDLAALWQAPAYVELRRRLEEFEFPPCTSCNSCELADDNQEDCFRNGPPACGGCLWAQGFIRCP
jgi:MoaA/NifB/PqqE/SkfB family radical SAM enzyme